MGVLKQKISQAMEQEFVGNIVFSDEEVAQIFESSGTLLRDYDNGYGNSISTGYDDLLFVAMVNAIKTWNSDDGFWECIHKKLLGYTNSKKVYLHLTKVIERLGRNERIFYLNGCKKNTMLPYWRMRMLRKIPQSRFWNCVGNCIREI